MCVEHEALATELESAIASELDEMEALHAEVRLAPSYSSYLYGELHPTFHPSIVFQEPHVGNLVERD
jgi:hypothetical protein